MKSNYPQSKSALLILALIFTSLFGYSQTSLQKAQDYVSQKGEVTFSFHINDPLELRQLTSDMSIVNFNSETNTVKVWTNAEQFRKFQSRGIEITVDDADNSATGIVMSNQLPASQRRGPYPLTFPLTAYPTYADYAAQMQAFADNHPNLCELVDIGGTTEGASGGNKRLLFIKLSDNIGTSEAEPKVMYTSSMHGDEITGYPLMLDLIDYFITAYEDTGHSDHLRIKNLLDNSEVWINPMANPDGTYYNNASNTSVANSRRANANNIDLNRNYPDNVAGPHANGHTSYELETQQFMTLADNNHFVLSANFHGGTEVVNYPFDNTYTNHADDDWFFLASKEYALNCQNNSPNGYMDAVYDNNQWPGVTEGADWYQVYGGRQDFMNFYHQCKEITIELSNTKVIPSNQLDDHWDYNREALIEYLIQGTYGFHGTVKDAVSGDPIEATIKLVGHDAVNSHTVSSLPFGDFYRPVFAGTYTILIEAPCYQSVTLNNQTIANYEMKALGDIMLTPATATAPSSLNTTGTDSSSTNTSWTAATADDFDIRYREVGASTWIEVTSVTNPYQITGLDPETTYEFQVRSYCGSNSTSYSVSEQFTTTAINYCDAEGGSISDEYISNVTLNGISNDTEGSTASGYSDLTNTVFTSLDLNSAGNTISVTKYWNGTEYNEAVSVWIDFNHNGTFDASEKIFESSSSKTTPVSTTFLVPNVPEAKVGTTRMRVIMKYYSGTGNTANNPCESFNYGEVEDYTINIIDPTLSVTTFNEPTILVYPNPYKETINIRLGNITSNVNLEVYDISGRSILSLNNQTPINNTIQITRLNSVSSGTYFIKVTDNKTNTSFLKRIIKQ